MVGWHHWLNEVWVSSRSWWWTEKPGMLQSVGLQRVKCDWVTFTFTNSSQKPLDCLSYCLLWLPLDASSHILSYTVLIIWSYKTTYLAHRFKSPQFSSVQLCPTIFDPMDCSMPGFSVHHQLLELAQTHVHRVGDAIQPSHPLSSPSPPKSCYSSKIPKTNFFTLTYYVLSIRVGVFRGEKNFTLKESESGEEKEYVSKY